MVTVCAGVLAFALGVAGQDDLVFDEVAKRWLHRNHLPAEEALKLELPGVLARAFARIELGTVCVYVPPASLQDAKTLKDVSTALVAVAEAQTTWKQWRTGTEPDPRAGDPLGDWLRSWTPKTFAALELAGADLVERLAPEPEVIGALADLRDAFERPVVTGNGTAPEHVDTPLVLFPRRAEFVELVCLAGWLDPVLRPSAWSDGVATWLEYDADGTHMLTLQYTANANGSWQNGVGVGERNPAALAELVTQVTARRFLRSAVAPSLDPALVAALANALVIDLHGELDTRIDGDVRARSSEARSQFVPGGNPNGGTLPPTSAENRWRGTKGKDHFVGILAQVQKKSGKKASSKAAKLSTFELEGDGGAKGLVTAPFLGAGGTAPEAALLPDYLELVRSYGVAFVHWLREDGADTSAASRAAFGRLVTALAHGADPERLPALFQEVYGQPLSASDAAGLFASPTLEGRFLTWLSKQR